jgi:hypothetical protein
MTYDHVKLAVVVELKGDDGAARYFTGDDFVDKHFSTERRRLGKKRVHPDNNVALVKGVRDVPVLDCLDHGAIPSRSGPVRVRSNKIMSRRLGQTGAIIKICRIF